MSFIPSIFIGVTGSPNKSATGWQPTFDEIGRALIDTTFVVVDLETTGGSHSSSAITEIGAVKINPYGEVEGHFKSFVRPVMMISFFSTEVNFTTSPIK